MLLLTLALAGCGKDSDTASGPPLDMILVEDGVTYAGAAIVDITPVILETYEDLDGDYYFDGCFDDPTASGSSCSEPWNDADGDGFFEPVFIGGFGPMRPARDVHDPVYARATVIAQDGEYIAFVGLDLVGLGYPRIHEARDALAADGFDPDRLLTASSHNHQGPDTMGLWGNPLYLADPISGMDPEYQERVAEAIEQAVREAAAAMEPVTLKVGAQQMRDRSPYFSGANFGGRNPTAKMHGMINDGRDPVVVSDQLLVIQGEGEGGVVFTLTNWSGHPEVRDSSNDLISSDWVGVTREVLEAEFGGVAMHMPECLGGMQSALGGDLPLVLEDGTHVYETCDEAAIADPKDSGCYGRASGEARTDEDGLPVPVWAEHDSWEFVTSHGWHIAEAAIDILAGAEVMEAAPIRVEAESFYVPIENVAYQLLGPFDIFDLGLDDAIFDTDLCPLAATTELGCIETRTFRAQVGPVGFVAVPGELLPELAWGFPDDEQWDLEAADETQRGDGARYFVQHPRACDGVDYDECALTDGSVGDCECLEMHAVPYTLSDDAGVPPLLDLVDTPYKAVLGMTDNYLSYIIPEPDFNVQVSLLSLDGDGDHYEDTVSPSHVFASELQAAQLRIQERW
jgi:hypothetical protein